MLVTGRLMLRSLRVASSSPSTPTLEEIAPNHHYPAGVAKVVLKKGKTQLFKDGSPMVYSGAVARVIGRPPPNTGDIVLVADGTEKPIGWGFYNSTSMFRVRLMQQHDEIALDPSSSLNAEKLLETRIAAAAMLRQNLGLPSAHTNAYRLVNSEGDRFTLFLVEVMENQISYLISLDGQKTGFYADQRENRCFLSTISEGSRVLDICCYTGGFALNAASGGALDVIGVDTSLPALQLAKENVSLNGLDPRRISFLRQDATEFMKAAVSRNESWDIVILDPPKLAPRKKVLKSASGMYRNLNYLAMQLTKRGGLLMTCSCSGAMTQSGLFFRILQVFRDGDTIRVLITMSLNEVSSLIVQSMCADCFRQNSKTTHTKNAVKDIDPPSGTFIQQQIYFSIIESSYLVSVGAASMAGRKITVVRQAGAACDHPIDPAYPEGEYLTNILLRVL
ncbi:ribosomal RNA large subunit methyltransferase I isoform X3 [Capsicum annuum]|uniref:ribosomal RNA large subunit methyltransferase I isoform X3 n=1 Tax=Capsicum annuum TaxID=4072 RepID=UPI001FB0FE6D|nr:ribosomal RNA large subunit methyltransferase I isoform X3 [Capsicum annuum]